MNVNSSRRAVLCSVPPQLAVVGSGCTALVESAPVRLEEIRVKNYTNTEHEVQFEVVSDGAAVYERSVSIPAREPDGVIPV